MKTTTSVDKEIDILANVELDCHIATRKLAADHGINNGDQDCVKSSKLMEEILNIFDKYFEAVL